MIEKVHGIKYTRPEVVLLQDTGIGTSEIAARTCYDSFDSSENSSVRNLEDDFDNNINRVNEIEHSDLLDDLAWTYFHHSILEHANLTFKIKGISRAVLQEHARHRIQSLSVRSTRYTMSSVVNIFLASIIVAEQSNCIRSEHSEQWFLTQMLELDTFVTSDAFYNRLEIESISNKLHYQMQLLGRNNFIDSLLSKEGKNVYNERHNCSPEVILVALNKCKKKRNVGDVIKHIVSDNVKVDMVVTMNLRGLKNYITLRDSGSAFFQIRWLAEEIIKATPKKYLDLIVRSK